MNMTKQKRINPIFKTVLIVFVAALMLSGCECLYPEKAKDPYNRTTSYQGDHLTADMLPGLWQCYYPMYVAMWSSRRSACSLPTRPTSLWRTLAVRTTMLKLSSGASTATTSRSRKATPPTNSRLPASSSLRSTSETPMGNTHGPSAVLKTVSSK